VEADAVVESDSWAEVEVKGDSGADAAVKANVEGNSGADAVVEKETSGIAVVATFSNHGFLCSVFLSSLPNSLFFFLPCQIH
jgi:hypothetical protein